MRWSFRAYLSGWTAAHRLAILHQFRIFGPEVAIRKAAPLPSGCTRALKRGGPGSQEPPRPARECGPCRKRREIEKPKPQATKPPKTHPPTKGRMCPENPITHLLPHHQVGKNILTRALKGKAASHPKARKVCPDQTKAMTRAKWRDRKCPRFISRRRMQQCHLQNQQPSPKRNYSSGQWK